jgi:LmbE family N-acetylglucosaminyl deacetylase
MMQVSPLSWPGFRALEPDDVFRGTLLIAVPHMDDEALACGGTIARLSRKERIHLVYAADGSRAPEPVMPWLDVVSPDLGAIRRSESVAAMRRLGVPEHNLHFLNLPEARLEKHLEALSTRMRELMRRIAPDHVLAPFRFDRHRDHVALNRVVTDACRALGGLPLTEYFVYHHWKLLPGGDVRRYLRPSELLLVDTTEVVDAKRAALECFRTQTTRFYAWQSRPNLTPALLDGVSTEPELFLRYRDSLPGAAVFTGSVGWIRVAHRLESPLKRVKDRAVALARRAFALRLRYS